MLVNLTFLGSQSIFCSPTHFLSSFFTHCNYRLQSKHNPATDSTSKHPNRLPRLPRLLVPMTPSEEMSLCSDQTVYLGL